MSDEERDKHDRPREGESEREWKQHQPSEERWLDLFHRLAVRVETNENRFEAYEEASRQRNERIESKIEFIVSQQAQFAADLQLSREEQEEKWRQQEESWKKADARWAETEKGIRALLAIAEIHEQEIAALAETQAAAQARTDRQLAQTGERLAETGERVDALVNTVERLISERRNGGAGESGEAREG